MSQLEFRFGWLIWVFGIHLFISMELLEPILSQFLLLKMVRHLKYEPNFLFKLTNSAFVRFFLLLGGIRQLLVFWATLYLGFSVWCHTLPLPLEDPIRLRTCWICSWASNNLIGQLMGILFRQTYFSVPLLYFICLRLTQMWIRSCYFWVFSWSQNALNSTCT